MNKEVIKKNKKIDQDQASLMEIIKEHMFEKVVTPSDVGKLNRLVIPKQHAERYFPLDHNKNNKGLLLNFEDLKGNSWRFRYSYWNSSQSYVMTKGWSRFVKDKNLVAGDIVSFHRDSCNKDKLFIDWKKQLKIHHQDHAMFSRVFYSFPMLTNYESFHRFQRDLGVGYYVRSMEKTNPTAVIESGGGKRLRLFGVDMECGGGGGGSMEDESSASGGSMPRGNVSMDASVVVEDYDHFFTKN